MIIGIEGGMRIAAEAAFDTIAADRARGYPRLPMAGMTTLPMAAASATEEPEISDWIMVATTVAMASPPRTKPTTLWARFTRGAKTRPAPMSPPPGMRAGMGGGGIRKHRKKGSRGRGATAPRPLTTGRRTGAGP